MVLLADEAQVEPRFGLFADRANFDTRKVHGLRRMYHWLRSGFGHTRWYSLGMRLKLKFILVCLEIVLLLTQDRCMVCTERTIGSELVLDAPDGTPM